MALSAVVSPGEREDSHASIPLDSPTAFPPAPATPRHQRCRRLAPHVGSAPTGCRSLLYRHRCRTACQSAERRPLVGPLSSCADPTGFVRSSRPWPSVCLGRGSLGCLTFGAGKTSGSLGLPRLGMDRAVAATTSGPLGWPLLVGGHNP